VSPAGRADAAALVEEAAPTGSNLRTAEPTRPKLRTAEPRRGRLAGVATTLRSGNLLGRIGTLTALALFMAVFGIVVFQALLVQGQARLDHLNGQIAVQQQDAKQLKSQLATLDAPERIVAAARAHGMVDAGDIVYLVPSAHDDQAAQVAPTTTTTVPGSRTGTGTSQSSRRP
jgi:cell division protein FtsL